jgi:hypothetical protein
MKDRPAPGVQGLIRKEEKMVKLMFLLWVIIAPTIAGIAVVGILASASPITGGASITQGTMILIASLVGILVALPISFFVAKAINRRISA